MGLISLTCPKCGAQLEVEEGKEIYFCTYCGNKMVFEKQKVELSGNVTVLGIATEKNLLDKGFIQLRNREFSAANDTFDRVLDINPRCSKAYFGRLLAELKVGKPEDLFYHNYPLTKYMLYHRALEFATDAEKKDLTSINDDIVTRLKKSIPMPPCPKPMKEPSWKRFLIRNGIISFAATLFFYIICTLNNTTEGASPLSFIGICLFVFLVICLATRNEYKKKFGKYKVYKEQLETYSKASENPDRYKQDIIDRM